MNSSTTERANAVEKVLRLALREIDENVSDIIGFFGEIDAGDDVGAVFRIGQPLRLGIGGLVGQRVDGRPIGGAAAARQRIAVDRDEQLRAAVPGQIAPDRQAARKCRPTRVITTRYLPVFSSLSRSMVANESTRFFSCSPLGAWVPVSMPPWPGSMTTIGRGVAAAIWRASSRGGRRLGAPRQAVVDRRRAQEGLAVDRARDRPRGGPAGHRRDRARTPG